MLLLGQVEHMHDCMHMHVDMACRCTPIATWLEKYGTSLSLSIGASARSSKSRSEGYDLDTCRTPFLLFVALHRAAVEGREGLKPHVAKVYVLLATKRA